MALWLLWVRGAYIDFSEGVYLLTGRELLAGGELYQSPVAAHPPGVYVVAQAVLSIDDSIWSARGLLAVLAAIQGALVAILTVKITQHRWLGVICGLLSLVTPWGLRGRSWEPEVFVGPLLLATVLVSQRPRLSWLAGLLGAVAGAFKLTYLLPALVIAALSLQPRRSVAWLAFFTLVESLVFVALYGSRLMSNVVEAQLQIGTVNLRQEALPLLWLAMKEAGPLLALAGVGWLIGRTTEARGLVRALGATAATTTALLITVVKFGTGINVLAVVEPQAIVLAAVPVGLALDKTLARGRVVLVAAAGVVVWLGVQSASLVAAPTDPVLSYAGDSWEATSSQADAIADRAAFCDPALAYSGEPFIAFLADRRMPGHEPDRFILRAQVHADALQRARHDRPRCP